MLWQSVLAIVNILANVFMGDQLFTYTAIITGMLGEICFSVGATCYVSAMNKGSFVRSVLIMNIGAVTIPVILSCLILKEQIFLNQIISLVLLIIIAYVIGYEKEEKTEAHKNWLPLIIVATVFGFIALFMVKVQQKIDNGNYTVAYCLDKNNKCHWML